MQTREDFLRESREAASVSSAYPRLLPSSFEPADPLLQAVPISRAYEWGSLGKWLASRDARVALLRLPLFWQVLSPVHEACEQAACSLFVSEKDNMPLAEAASRVGGADTVITASKDAFEFSLYLAEKNVRIPNWFVIHDVQKEWDLPAMLSDEHVAQEVHLFPGVPLLIQCEALGKENSTYFHAAPDMSIRLSEKAVLVSSESALFVPLREYQVDITLASRGTCTCGKEMFAKE